MLWVCSAALQARPVTSQARACPAGSDDERKAGLGQARNAVTFKESAAVAAARERDASHEAAIFSNPPPPSAPGGGGGGGGSQAGVLEAEAPPVAAAEVLEGQRALSWRERVQLQRAQRGLPPG